jgi:hypothetical protein
MALRKVCQVREFRKSSCPFDGATVELHLKCGHTIYKKRSAYTGGRVHCRECGNGK